MPAPTPGSSPAITITPDPKDEPIKLPPTLHTSREVQKQQEAWYDRNMVQPFLKHIPDDKPWKSDAREYIKRAVTAWESELNWAPLAADGKQLIKAGCDDPLLSFLVQYFRCYTGDKTGVAEAAKDAFSRMDREKYYSRAVARMAGMAASDVAQAATSARSAEIDQRVVELTGETLLAGDYPGDDDYLFLRHTATWPWGWNHFINNYEAIAGACAAAKAPEWIQHMFRGAIEVKRAWDQRGSGYADTVSKEGWLGFEKRCQIARDEYTAAWKLHPQRPDAASSMIAITMAGYGNAGDTMRLWFDRAVAVQFDYMPAYGALAWGLRPRWIGSVPRMLRFARLCAETRQFDTDVPQEFFQLLEDASQEEEWRKAYRDPLVAPLVVPTALGLAEDPSRRGNWEEQYSLAAVRAYLVGDGAAAAEALKKAGGYLASAGADLLYEHGGDFNVMKREIALLQSPAGKSFWASEQLYDEGNLDDAIAGFQKCEAELEAAGNPLSSTAHARAQALQVEKAVAAGGWVKIPLESGIWRFQGGNWKTTPDGSLEFRAGYGNAMAFATPRIGARFELRCEIEVDSPTKDEAVAGVLLGEHGTGYYVVCGFKQSRGVDTLQATATDRWDAKSGPSAPVAAQMPNTVLIRVSNGHATYHLNGLPVADNYRANSSPLNKEDSRIGLAARGLHPGTTIRVRNLEVRTDFSD